MENYFFEAEKEKSPDKVFVLIIYDIVDNKRRTKLAKYLQGFGFRVQKSAFEAVIPKKNTRSYCRASLILSEAWTASRYIRSLAAARSLPLGKTWIYRKKISLYYSE